MWNITNGIYYDYLLLLVIYIVYFFIIIKDIFEFNLRDIDGVFWVWTVVYLPTNAKYDMQNNAIFCFNRM